MNGSHKAKEQGNEENILAALYHTKRVHLKRMIVLTKKVITKIELSFFSNYLSFVLISIFVCLKDTAIDSTQNRKYDIFAGGQ